MTKIEIIDETVEFYSNNPRSVEYDSNGYASGCNYLSKNGEKCAFSRCCTDESIETLHNRHEGSLVGSLDNPEGFLKEEYQGHAVNFWSGLQSFHDNDDYWTKEGLSEAGKIFVNEFKQRNKSA